MRRRCRTDAVAGLIRKLQKNVAAMGRGFGQRGENLFSGWQAKMQSLDVIDQSNVALPAYLRRAHDLCWLHHDTMVELLRSGEENEVFVATFDFQDPADRQAFEQAADIFSWLERSARTDERAECLRIAVFPAVLSDMLHFVCEALRCSGLGKLPVAYALIRKPIQENLFLLESMILDLAGFAENLAQNPLHLRAKKSGGLEVHTKRIEAVLDAINESDRFDAGFLANLRYSKDLNEGFDGACNRALHLFTEHPAIRTEQMNINSIFADDDARQTQWYFIYSRLPYLLDYMRSVVEHVCRPMARTHPEYLEEIERRVAATTLLWAPQIETSYRHAAIDRYVKATSVRLIKQCISHGVEGALDVHAVQRMHETGAIPGESDEEIAQRHERMNSGNIEEHAKS